MINLVTVVMVNLTIVTIVNLRLSLSSTADSHREFRQPRPLRHYLEQLAKILANCSR
jgi:flagellar basal body-associated protein FliL